MEFKNDKGGMALRKRVEFNVFIIANWLISFFVKVGQSLESESKIVKAPVRTASLSNDVEIILHS